MAKKEDKKGSGAVVAKQDFEARLQSEVQAARTDGEAIGACKAFEASAEVARLMKLATMYKALKNKEYKAYGMTAEEFCDSVGENRRNVDRMIEDLTPIIESFSDKFNEFSGCKFNKIRLLGRAVSDNVAEIEDGMIVFEGDKFGPKDLPEFLGRVEEAYSAKVKDGVKKGLDKELAVERKKRERDVSALKGELARWSEIIPESDTEMTKAAKQVMYCEAMYGQFEAAVSALAYEVMEVEDANIAAKIDGLWRTIYARIEHAASKWEAHKRGEVI